jgi:hypothetical protein
MLVTSKTAIFMVIFCRLICCSGNKWAGRVSFEKNQVLSVCKGVRFALSLRRVSLNLAGLPERQLMSSSPLSGICGTLRLERISSPRLTMT